MTSYPYSWEITKRSGSNFYWSFFFLPREKRNAIRAVYAFSRLVDDAVDEAEGEEGARLQIEIWRARLALCFNGHAVPDFDSTLFHPLLSELSDTIRRFQIPPRYFLDLLKGVEMDLTKKRYETFGELETYCYHVAGTIGLLCNHLFGIQDQKGQKGEDYALLLGRAFQLTNILRDLGSDANRGRLYLPREDLARFGLTTSDLLERRGGNEDLFLKLMRFEAARAEACFQEAFRTLSPNLRKSLIPAEIMSAFYHRILQRLQEENFPVYEKKVLLSQYEKVGLIAKTLVRSVFS